MKPFENIEFIEIPVISTGQTTFNFPQNIENVEKGFVTGVVVYNVAAQTDAPSGNNTVNATVYKKAALTLNIGNEERFAHVPLSFFDPSLNNGLFRELEPCKIVATKSKITIPDTVGLVAGESFVIGFIYKKVK